MRLTVVCLSVFLVALPAAATNLTADCTGAPATFTSITSALNTLDLVGPHTITVLGTCNESPNLRARNGISIEGSTITPGAIHLPPGGSVNVERSHGITLRRLTITGGGRGVFVHAQSELTLDNVTIDGAGTCLTAFDESVVTVGGKLATNAVVVQNCVSGVALTGSTLTSNGFFTVQNNSNVGIDAARSGLLLIGQVSGPNPGGMNVIANNGGNGIFAHESATVDLIGKNSVAGNTLNGALAFQSSTINTNGSPGLETTIENNTRGGVAMIFNSSARLVRAIVQNNADGNPLASGVTSSQNSALIIDSSSVTGTNGPGVLAEAGGFVRMFNSSVSGNSGDQVALRTGAMAELQSGNTIDPGTAKFAVVCDATALLFGDGANVPADCKKK